MTLIRDNEDLMVRALEDAPNRTGHEAAIVLKDYRVCEILRVLQLQFPSRILFKGGTSLAKGWGRVGKGGACRSADRVSVMDEDPDSEMTPWQRFRAELVSDRKFSIVMSLLVFGGLWLVGDIPPAIAAFGAAFLTIFMTMLHAAEGAVHQRRRLGIVRRNRDAAERGLRPDIARSLENEQTIVLHPIRRLLIKSTVICALFCAMGIGVARNASDATEEVVGLVTTAIFGILAVMSLASALNPRPTVLAISVRGVELRRPLRGTTVSPWDLIDRIEARPPGSGHNKLEYVDVHFGGLRKRQTINANQYGITATELATIISAGRARYRSGRG